MKARQLTLLGIFVALAACSSGDGRPRDLTNPLPGFIGGVVADEPQAALIGNDILAIGGSAADAAVAMYLAMAVTLPSQASLGGGGVCVAFGQRSGDIQALDFVARAPAQVTPGADRPSAVPGNVRGFYTLHARFGQLPWGQVVAPAERLARFGADVSRALASDLDMVRPALAEDAEIRRTFTSSGRAGDLAHEGDRLIQVELAAVLSRLRSGGPASFYAGPSAQELVAAVKAAGGTLETSDLLSYRPEWREPLRLSVGRDVAHFAPPPLAGGAISGQMLAMMQEGNRFRRAAADERPHLVLETATRALIDLASWEVGGAPPADEKDNRLSTSRIRSLMAGYRPERRDGAVASRLPPPRRFNPAAASLAAVDRDGNAVACSVTLNSLFGTGRIAPGTGIVLAALPGGPDGRGADSLGPMVVINENTNVFRFAAAAAGGLPGATALAQVAAGVVLADEPLESAMAAPRVHSGGEAGRSYAEQSLEAAAVDHLRRQGHPMVVTPTLGRVTAISCPNGLPRDPTGCTAAADPRGFGLAVMSQR